MPSFQKRISLIRVHPVNNKVQKERNEVRRNLPELNVHNTNSRAQWHRQQAELLQQVPQQSRAHTSTDGLLPVMAAGWHPPPPSRWFTVRLWTGQRNSSAVSNPQWQIWCLCCSAPWPCADPSGYETVRSKSWTFAVGEVRALRASNRCTTGQKATAAHSLVCQHCWCQTAEALLWGFSSLRFPP